MFHTKESRLKIERIQRKFSRLSVNYDNRILGGRHLTYEERLKRCNIPSLTSTFIYTDLTAVAKMISGDFYCPVDLVEWSTVHVGRLRKPRHLSKIRANFFYNRSINIFNELPESEKTPTGVEIWLTGRPSSER